MVEIADREGWVVLSGDVFMKTKPRFTKAVCISREAASKEINNLAKLGVESRLLFTGESPNVSWSFYHNIERLSEPFRHVCLFRGIRHRVHHEAVFHDHYWPMCPISVTTPSDFHDRRLLTMIASFKERYPVNRENMLSILYIPVKWSKILYYQLRDPNARFPDLYRVRLEAIISFASQEDFYLFGRYWHVARKYVPSIRRLRFANEPRSCEDKIKTLGSFRFSLAIENCVFPGYVTEKICDAMMAGTIPVYLGAPDIEDFVPKECFVDMRNYSDFEDLWKYLSSWSHRRWRRKINEIEAFLRSSAFDPFRAEMVAEQYFRLLTE